MPYVEQKLGGGLNLKASATDIRDDQLQQASGCRYDTEGAVSSENGRSTLHSATGEVRGLADATISGVKSTINKRGTTLYKDSTSIGAFGGGVSHISVVPYNDYAYVADGATFKRYKTSLEDVGLDRPSAALTVAAGDETAETLAAGDYKYTYTFYNGVAESNFAPSASVTISGDPKKANLSVIAAGPTGTTSRRVYRTDKNGNSFFFVTEIANNTTTTFTDANALPPDADPDIASGVDVTTQYKPADSLPFDQASYSPSSDDTAPSDVQDSAANSENNEVWKTNLGYFADWTDHDKPPGDLSHLVFINEQIFGISNNKVRFSRVVEPEHWPVFNSFPVGRQTGDTIRSLKELDGRLVIYTDAGVYVYSQIGLTFEDGRLEQSNSPVGLAGEWAITDVTLPQGGAGHLFLGKNGLYLFDALNAIEMSFAVEPLFTDPNHPDYINPNSMNTVVMASSRDKVWMSYASGSGSANDKTLFVDFQDAQDPKIAVLPYGYTTLRRDSISNAVIGGDSSGVIYEVNTGGSNGGSSLTWEPITKDFDFGEPTRLKTYKEVVLDADFGGVTTTVTITTSLGYTSSFTDSSSGRSRIRHYLPTTMKGYSANIKVSSDATAARHLYAVGWSVDGMSDP